MKLHSIPTKAATLSIADSEGTGPTVLLIHGNSAARDVFERQMSAPLAQAYRLLAVDLPGHGASTDAADPERDYTIPGLAATLTEALTALGARDAVVVGWSLGGHIGIEMIGHLPELRGLLISGTPPAPKSPDALAQCFRPTPAMALTGKPDFTEDELHLYAANVYDGRPEPFMIEAARRTDGRLRAIMLTGFAQGLGLDQREAVVGFKRPLAIVNGADDPFINGDYFATVPYGNLWSGKVHALPDLGHAPFWHGAATFNALLGGFLGDVLPSR